MSLFENLSKKVTDTAKAAAKKSSELVEVTKLNMAIGSEEEKIEKTYSAIGKIVYELYDAGEEVNAEFSEQCEKIKSYEANIKDMKQKILDLKNIKICSSCGAEVENEVAF
jgi:archaellum component FlaC